MKRKMVSALLAATLVMTALAGCGGGSDSTASESDTAAEATGEAEVDDSAAEESTDTADEAADEEATADASGNISVKVGWAPPDVTGVFATAEDNMNKAIEDAKQYGIDVELTTIASPDETQVENQVRSLENLIQSGMDVIICSPGSFDAVSQTLYDAVDQGIELILVNVAADEVPDDLDCTIIGFDNTEAGTVSGYAMLDQLGGPGVVEPGEQVEVAEDEWLDLEWWEDLYADFDYSSIEGKVAVIGGIEGSIYSNNRLAGFNSVMDKCENVEVVDTLYADWAREAGTSAAENILQANPELDAIWSASSEMTMGAVTAVSNLNRTEVLISGNDGTEETVDAIRNGQIVTETWHGFPEWGWYGIQYAVMLATGQGDDVPDFYDICPRTEYAGNADQFYPDTKLDAIPWEDIIANAS